MVIDHIRLLESLLEDNRTLHRFARAISLRKNAHDTLSCHLMSLWMGGEVSTGLDKTAYTAGSPFAGFFNQIVADDLSPSILDVSTILFVCLAIY